MNEGIFILDPQTKEKIFMPYSEMEQDTIRSLLKPTGGFCYPASDFLLLPLTEAPFYVRGWLPKFGKCVLYAPAKAGKTFLATQLARCVGQGEPFLGMPTTRGRVLLLQFELGQQILQDRMQSTHQEYPNVFVGTTFSMKLDTQGGQHQLKLALDAILPQVLILDPLYKAMDGEENESSDMKRIVNYLDEIIEAYSCSIFLIHHAGKDITKGGRGSSVLEDWVDSYIELRRLSKNGEPLRSRITPKLMRHLQPPDAIEIELRNGEFELTGGQPTVKQQVAEFIVIGSKQGLPTTPKDLFDMGIGSNASVYAALNSLVEEGQVEKLGRGEYKWK